MKLVRRTLTGSNAIALVALFVALSGTAGAAGYRLITGADIKNRSITGVDIKAGSLSGSELERDSVSGSDIKDGSIRGVDLAPATLATLIGTNGAAGPKGDAGPAGAPATLENFGGAGPDINNYQDRDPIVAVTAPDAGYYLAIANATVTNTGSSNDYLNCGFEVAGSLSGAAGFDTTAGNSTSGSSVTVAPTTQPDQSVTFVCMGSGATTFDITDIKLKLVKLADQ